MHYESKYCPSCKCNTGHYNGKCGECSSKEADRAKREHFGKLSALTTEERIRLIEEQLYQIQIRPPWIEPTD